MLDSSARDRLARVRCFLLDMDGTFYRGDNLIEGSLGFLKALRRTGRQALFLTNNSSKDAGTYVEKLRRMGVEEPFLRVYTSGQATGRYCLERFAGGRAFLLGNGKLKDELSSMGVLIDGDRPDYVIVGFDTTLTYAKLARVCDLVRAGLPYVATHPDFTCPTETGFIPDIGAIMAFIEASAGRQPDVVVGKPHRWIVEGALDEAGVTAGEAAMVGDRLYTDVATGVNHGMTAILVLSGEATLADVETSPVKPHLIVSGLGELARYLDA